MKGRKIHQFFREQDFINEVVGFPISDLPYNLCWYPSAGFDFRHIIHFELSPDFINNKPLVYLLTDPHISMYSQKALFPFAPGTPLHISESQGVALIVKNCCEVNLKQELGFHPFCQNTFDHGLLHDNFHDHYSGNVFFILADLHALQNLRKIQIEIPMFYFTYENMDFFMNFILPNGLRINTVVNIRDGSGYGGSSYPMDFIYQFQRQLKLKRIITDRDLISGFADFDLIESGLQEYYNFQLEQNFFNRANGRVSQQIFQDFTLNRLPFKGWKQERTSLPANDLSHYQNNNDPLFFVEREF